MSGSFGSVRWNECVHRLDLGLYSHPKQFLGNGVRNHVNSKEKPLLPEKFSSEENLTHDAVSSKTVSPTQCQLSYSGHQSNYLSRCVSDTHFACCWGAKQPIKPKDKETKSDPRFSVIIGSIAPLSHQLGWSPRARWAQTSSCLLRSLCPPPRWYSG